jgi:RNA polymerase subunit RPABC4/transcription elongation factor Spt4
MEILDSLLQYLEENGRRVILNLWLTEACNFQCAHCFYGKSPRSPKGYISNDMLYAIYSQQVRPLLDMKLGLTVNLIGGEPTLNLDEFERVLNTIETWGSLPNEIEIEMTTNGWWLQRAKHARRFLEIVRHLASDDGIENGFSVRVSSGRYHQEFFKYGDPKSLLDELFESGSVNGEPVLWEEEKVCMSCNETFDTDQEACPECGSEDYDYQEKYGYVSIEPPNSNSPWIYAQDTDGEGIAPSGIRGEWGNNDKGARWPGYCGNLSLCFDPKGYQRDGCCSGGDHPFGTVDDHPLVLLTLIRNFIQEVKPTCYGCRNEALSWMKDPAFKERKAQLADHALQLSKGTEDWEAFWEDQERQGGD